MQPLPPGWRVSNNTGSFTGPPRVDVDNIVERDDKDTDSNDEDEEGVDIRPDSPGWEDVEPEADVEFLNIKCLLCDSNFQSATLMLTHCAEAHELDFLSVREKHRLDFYSTIKLVNYIRSTVQNGNSPALNDPQAWADDKFLQPVLEEDALLFSLDDLVDFDEAEPDVSVTTNGG